jgi:23S rRNA (cytosine1962-C5)-methyltransferase
MKPNPVPSEAETRPHICLLKGHSKRLRQGHPWLYSNEVVMDDAARAVPPGALVELVDAGDERLGVATFNPHSLIAGRRLAAEPGAAIDREFLVERMSRALSLREACYDAPYYRLIHSEADRLPGLVVDRYGEVMVCQLNSAGMDRLSELIVAALDTLLAPRAIVLRGDSPIRSLEGLERTTRIAKGEFEGPLAPSEGGVTLLADRLEGQKTGWYFDQRDNRDFVARLCAGRSMLDVYCYSGGFALRGAAAGARAVLGIDRSEAALALADQVAERNGLAGNSRFMRADVLELLARFDAEHEHFDVVVADPPSFVKARRDLKGGLRAYRKLARLAARVTATDGFVALASCSHHVDAASFGEAVARGVADAGRHGRIIRSAGAGPDHPIHPALPESAYLKCLVLALD